MVVRLVFIIALAVSLTIGGRAGAEPQEVSRAETSTQGQEERARALFAAGIDKIRVENWPEAERDLRESYELVERASTLYNLALVVFKQSRLVESLALASKVLRTADPVADVAHRENATRLIERIGQQVAVVEVTITPPDASISVDDRLTQGAGGRRRLIVEPGQHRLRISRDGYAAESMEVVLFGGKERFIDVELEPVDKPTSSATPTQQPSPAPALTSRPPDRLASDSARRSIAPWFAVGVGGALLGAAIVTGILSKNADDDFVEQCPDLHDCDPDLQQLRDRAKTLAVVTDVLLVSGGVTVLGGLTWWYFTPPTAPRHALRAGAVVTSERVELRLRSAF